METHILSVLKKDEWTSTSKVAVLVHNNYYKVEICLNSLLKSKKIKKMVMGRAVYWRLKK